MSTRDQILESAWKLFSEKGFEDVSVRDVTNDAGVNLASVSYHFGSKSGLIQEVVKKIFNPMNRRRLDLLEEVVAKKGIDGTTLRDIVEAFVRPIVFPEEYGGNREIFARLTARYLIERDYAVPTPVLLLMNEMFQHFIGVIKVKVPSMKREVIMMRLLCCNGATIYQDAFAAKVGKIAGASAGVPPREDEDERTEQDFNELVNFCIAGFTTTA